MSKIRVMDEILANKIAAGEVVERCANVVKELVENSIDALATEIKVSLIESGTKEIKVIDNGVGMSKEDAVLAFGRHATSKLIKEDDLYHIDTLGFRGEALASIASVSNITLKTSNGDTGTLVILEGGRVTKVEGADLRKGTSITVADLFYNTPARLKHMKNLYTELSSITDYMNKIALSHPEIKFTVTNNDSVLLNTDGSNNLLKTIKDIYGIKTVKKMLEVETSDDDYEVKGYISLPEIHRSSRNHMITLVNGRVVRNTELNRVINDAYHSYKPDNRYPIVVLTIEVDPSLIDVNIHPTKMDIKFSKMEELKILIEQMIKACLSKGIFIPKVIEDEEESEVLDKPIYIEQKLDLRGVKEELEEYILIDEGTNDFQLFNYNEVNKEPVKEEKKRLPELYPVGIVHGTYIVCQNDTGMYLIDQHAAKERCNYELFKEKLGNPPKEKTSMLFPLTFEFTTSEFIVLKENFNLLKNIGFEIEEFGMNSMIVKAHPTWLKEDTINDSIKQILDVILMLEKDFSIEKFNENVATMMSCKKAIKANDYITMSEVQALLDDLNKCDNPFHCPHGRPTIIFNSNYDLEKMFKRSGF